MDNTKTRSDLCSISADVLSVLDVVKDGKVVTAEVWTRLWELTFKHLKTVSDFCISIDEVRTSWLESEQALANVVSDFNIKYESLEKSFIHYGAEPPTDPHVKFWLADYDESDRDDKLATLGDLRDVGGVADRLLTYDIENGNVIITGRTDNAFPEHYVMPDSIEGCPVVGITTPDGALFNGTAVKYLTLPRNLSYIEGYPFAFTNIKIIRIPRSLTHIGKAVGDDTYGLTDIYYEGTEVEWNQIDFESRFDSNPTVHYNQACATKDYVDNAVSNGSLAGEPGEDGATFIPDVSADGTLSWTNDKGLANPKAMNIKGPKGDPGAPGEQGPKGDKGDKGAIALMPVADLPTEGIDPSAIYLKAVTDWIGSTGGWTNGAITIAVANLKALLADAKYVKLVVKRQDDAAFTVQEAGAAITFITNNDEVGTPSFSKGTIDNGTVHNGISNRAYTSSLHLVSNYKSISVAAGWAVWAHLYTGDRFEEYLYVDGAWESLGGGGVEINLADYVKNTDYASDQQFGIVKATGKHGIGVNVVAGLYIVQAVNGKIDAKTDQYSPITPKNLDYAIKVGVTTNTITLTDAEKETARAWIGAIGKDYFDSTLLQTNMRVSKVEESIDTINREKADKTYVDNAVANVEVPTKVSQLTNDSGYLTTAPVTKVNGKTGEVTLSATDVGARPNTWTPSYTDVGADKSGTADSKVSTHNTNDTAHNDIRLLIQGLTTRLDALANSSDQDLDQMAEIVAYIKANKSLIDSITTSKVNVADIIDNLTTSVSNKPLSAKQGVALKGLVDALSSDKLDATQLPTAIETALSQAKASGEFDGARGARGTSILRVTTALTSHTTTVGGFTPKYRIALATVKSESGASEVRVGDTILRNYYTYRVGYVDATYAYVGVYASIRGAAGKDGTGIASIARTSGNGAAGTTDTYTITYTDDTTSTYDVYNGKDGEKGDKGDPYTLTDADKSSIAASVKNSLNAETWTFTLEDGTTVTKKVVLA